MDMDKDAKNRARAARANIALMKYADRKGSEHDEDETHLIDFLSDIRHLCGYRADMDFDRAIRISREHYEAETHHTQRKAVI